MTCLLKKDITGVILTGGLGRRAQGKDKGLLTYNSQSMIERQLSWFSSQVPNIVISANRNIQHYKKLGCMTVHDLRPDYLGPLSGIESVLSQINTTWIFVQPVDVPFLPTNLIELLLHAIGETNHQGYYLVGEEKSHYLSCLLSTNVLPCLSGYLDSGGRRVQDFLQQINAQPINLLLDEKCFSNFNEINDYLY